MYGDSNSVAKSKLLRVFGALNKPKSEKTEELRLERTSGGRLVQLPAREPRGDCPGLCPDSFVCPQAGYLQNYLGNLFQCSVACCGSSHRWPSKLHYTSFCSPPQKKGGGENTMGGGGGSSQVEIRII